MSFSPLIPLGQQMLGLRFVELPTSAISVSLTTEAHKNNTDTFRVANKQCYEIILSKSIISKSFFLKVFPESFSFQENFTRQYFSLSQMWTYSKSLLTVISANSTFLNSPWFPKVKNNVLLRYLSFFVMTTSICLFQISLTNQKWTLLRTNTYQAF